MTDKVLRYADSCLIIDAIKGDTPHAAKAMQILDDPGREWASSFYVKLEVMPGPTYHKREDEREGCESYFARITRWAECNEPLLHAALHEASVNGVLGAVDALHVAAAAQLGCHELVTSEAPDKPIHRAKGVAVRSIR